MEYLHLMKNYKAGRCCKDRAIIMDFHVKTILILMTALLMENSSGLSGFSEMVSSSTADAQDESECTTPNYLEYGQPGVIECSFETPLFGVFWFNSTEYNNESHMIIFYSNSQTQGAGFHSGEFDLSPTGSLIIKNVTFQHDHVFTVLKFNSISDDTIPIFVNVVVIVKPLQKFPRIDTCEDNRFCLRDAGEMKMLSCYVNNSWPAINLNFWTYNRHHQNWTEVLSSKSIAVQPNPQWVVVDGCFARHNCSLPVRRTGFLRCGVRGVRPVVSLKWRFVDTSSLLNKFQKENLVVVKNSDSTYDVTLTSEYDIKEVSIVTVTVECFAIQTDDILGHWSHLSTQVNLELTTETTIDCCEKATSEHFISAAIAAAVSIVVSCFSFGLSSLVHARVRRIKPKEETE